MSQSALEELRSLLEKGPETQIKDPALEALLELMLTPDPEMVKNVHIRAYIIMQADRIFKEEKLTGKRTAEGLKLYPLKDFRGFAYKAASLIEADYRLKDVSKQEKEISQAFSQAKTMLIKTLDYSLRHIINNAKQTKSVTRGMIALFRELNLMRERFRIKPKIKSNLNEQLFSLLKSYLPDKTPDTHIDKAIFSILRIFGIEIKESVLFLGPYKEKLRTNPPIK